MSRFQKAKEWYEENERRISTGSLLFGFFFDSLTLQRIDSLRENTWIALNLVVVGACIVLLNRPQSARTHFWLTNFLQFGFGATLGAFFIFYFRSATLSASWPFLLLLLGAMVANELFQKRYTRLALQTGFFYFALFLFAIFLVPVVVRRIGPEIFLLSGAVSLGALWLYTLVLRHFVLASFEKSRTMLVSAVAGIFVFINLLYFTNVIPPIPLSLKDAGLYHSIVRTPTGYLVGEEERGWLGFLRLREKVHLVPGEPFYVYSAIFSPANLDTRIIHEWQYKSQYSGEWLTATRIPLSVSGGRAEGWRTFSEKQNLTPGIWRVNVATPRGQLIGRVTFQVVHTDTPVPLRISTKE